MDHTITQLTVQKNNKHRVSVYLDDRYEFSLGILIAARLSTGGILTDEEVTAIKREDEEARAYDAAVRFLGRRARSVREMRQYLSRKEFPPECTDHVIQRLEDKRYLNDRDFARLWIEDRLRLNPKGAFALRQELRQKGIDEVLIDEALSGYDETRAAMSALEPKLRQWENADPDTLKKKIYAFLSQRGFSYDTTLAVVETVLNPP
ncbi:RecX family transcriptional regulator [Desulfatiferula olefinivorans]